MSRLDVKLPRRVAALLRWCVVVLCATGGFLVPWSVLLAAHVSRDVALAMAPAVSAAVLAGATVWASRAQESGHAVAGASSRQSAAPESAGRSTTASARLSSAEPISRHLPSRRPVLHEAARAVNETVLVGDVPREPVAFQRRAGLFSRLQDAVEDERVTVVSAVTGVRGVGKTQLAGAYARKCIAEHWAVVAWIVAEDVPSLQAGLAELAEQLGVRSPGQDAERAALAARDHLERITARSLVVFDNATDPDEVARWLPRAGRTQVVITSTLRTFAALGTTVDVDVFSADEAIAYLQRRVSAMVGQDAAALAHELGYLPLALNQAAWLINIQGLTAAQYVERLHSVSIRQVLGRVPGEPYPRGMAQAALLSLAEAEGTAPDTPLSDLVDLMSVLSPGGVGRDLLVRAVCARSPAASTADVDAALGALASCSLITYTLDGTGVIMHRLVQRVVRDRLRERGSLLAITARAAEATGRVLGARSGQTDSIEVANSIVDQVNALWSAARFELETPLAPHAADQVTGLLDLRVWAVSLLTFSDQTGRAIALGMEVLADTRRLLPEDEVRVFGAMTRLGTAYGTAWDHEHAVPVLREAVSGFTRTLGPDATQTLGAMNELGRFAEAAGLLTESVDVLESALQSQLRTQGQHGEATLVAQVNLANAYRAARRDVEAIELLEHNLTDNLHAHGKDHRQTINARGELARSYTRVGRTDEAAALLRENIDECRRLYGAPNQAELFWHVHLAEALTAAGDHDEAIETLTATVADMVRQLRPDHPETLEARVKRARAYLAASQPRPALKELEDTRAQMVKVLGAEHPKTLNTARYLACALALAGDHQAAIDLITETLGEYRRVLGTAHPYTVDIEAEMKRINTLNSRQKRFPGMPSHQR